MRTVGVGIVDEQHHALRVHTVDRPGTAHELLPRAPGRVADLLPDHDQAFAVRELTVLDAATIALDLESHLESERVAQPVDRGRRVAVERAARDPGPILRCWLH